MKIGYNLPFFYNQFKENKYLCTDVVLEKIKNLSPNLLRFPGGTLANYYDVNGPGYGYETTQATSNYIVGHVDMINKLSNVGTVYVSNVYQALLDPTKTQYWIENTLKSLSLIPNVLYVELGNEINIDGVYMQVADKPQWWESVSKYTAKVTAKAENYATISNQFYDAIKAKYPAIKIGVPMGNPFTIRNKEWNRVLRLRCKFDFEIFHMYMTTKTYDTTLSEAKKHFVDCVKPIAVTEWSWQHGNQASNVLNQQDIGQPYYDQFFINFPKICAMLGNVEFICRHQLYGDTVYSVIKK